MCNLVIATVIDASANDAKHFNECMKILTVALSRHQTNTRIAHVLATHAQKDMDWQLALKGPDRDKAIAALEAEMTSLQSTILTEIKAADKEYKTACELATRAPGRLLLGTKRNEKQEESNRASKKTLSKQMDRISITTLMSPNSIQYACPFSG